MSKQRRARVRQFIFAFYMSGIMSMMMSGVITVINTGLAAGFSRVGGPLFWWLGAWPFRW